MFYSSTLQDEICDICGDAGFDNALATCSSCGSREHGYDNILWVMLGYYNYYFINYINYVSTFKHKKNLLMRH